MKKVLGILLVVAMVVSVMPVVSFASDASQLPDELANYQVGKVYYDVNFDNGTLTGTNGKALSENQMTTASSTISDGVYNIANSGTTAPYLYMDTVGSEGAGVYVWELKATFDSTNETNKFNAERRLNVFYNGDSYKLIRWDWGNTHASLQVLHGKPTGIKIYPGDTHTYKAIVDTVNGKAWFYLDNELIYTDTTTINKNSVIGYSQLYAGNAANVTDTFDDIKMYKLIRPAINSVTRDDSYGDVHAGAKVSFTVDATVGENSTLSYYVNGIKKGTVADGKFAIDVQAGANDVFVQVDGTSIKSDVVSVTGIGYNVEKIYNDVNFDDETLGAAGAALIASKTNGSTGDFVDGAYNFTLTSALSEATAPYLATASATNDGAGVYLLEVTATYTNPNPTNASKPFDANRIIKLYYNNDNRILWKLDYYNTYANLHAMNVDTKIDIRLGETHTYRAIIDSANKTVYFYFDDVLVRKDTTTLTNSTIGAAQIIAGCTSGSSDTFDNIKFYKIATVENENTYTYTSGNDVVTSIAAVDASKALNVNAILYKGAIADGTEVAMITAVRKISDNSLASVTLTPVTFVAGKEYQTVPATLNNLPADISTGGYKVCQYIWGWGESNMLVPLEDVVDGLK